MSLKVAGMGAQGAERVLSRYGLLAPPFTATVGHVCRGSDDARANVVRIDLPDQHGVPEAKAVVARIRKPL